jgi:hypothetical protein
MGHDVALCLSLQIVHDSKAYPTGRYEDDLLAIAKKYDLKYEPPRRRNSRRTAP